MKKSEYYSKIASLYPLLLWFSYRYCRIEDDRKDLVMDTICKMLENYGKYNPEHDICSWGYVIMKNLYCTRYKRSKIIGFIDVEMIDEPAVIDVDVSITIMLEEVSKILLDRRVKRDEVILFSEGYSYDEISIIKKIPLGTVKSRISDSRKLLKMFYSERILF
jgi:RNA polymerase sigma-70 factor (ECF subfamily)